MSVDAIGNFLTIIRNGVMASKSFVVAPYSKMNWNLAQILRDEGFIQSVVVADANALRREIKILLKYVDGESAIHEITRISKPGCRHYSSIKQVKPVIDGLGVSILSTNRGVITHKKAKQLNVGGEVVCTVW
ncbi:30S ribosomal protein S8 [Candidatus Dependentiae bacterium]|nr:30S ribosomal protein S8 [Candidatus Dependentiae bacterium]